MKKTEEDFSLVSVIMTVYNDVQFLEKSISSIIQQTYSNFELIIIDDGSSHNKIRDIVLNFADKRIKYFKVHHSGVTRCLNLGIGISKGKYIFRQDADDYSDSKRIYKQVEYLNNHPEVGMLCSVANIIDMNDTLLDVSQFHPFVNEYLEKTNPIIHGTVVFRKTILAENGLYNDLFPICQSYDMWLRLSRKTEIHMLKEPLYYFRKHQNSHTTINYKENEVYRGIIRNIYINECLVKEVSNYNFYEKYSKQILEIEEEE